MGFYRKLFSNVLSFSFNGQYLKHVLLSIRFVTLTDREKKKEKNNRQHTARALYNNHRARQRPMTSEGKYIHQYQEVAVQLFNRNLLDDISVKLFLTFVAFTFRFYVLLHRLSCLHQLILRSLCQRKLCLRTYYQIRGHKRRHVNYVTLKYNVKVTLTLCSIQP